MRKLLLIGSAGLALRLALLGFVNLPGVADPNHYYNLALRLVDGESFTADYIWQYNDPPASIEHPEVHWMPMTSFLAAGAMELFGRSVRIALLPFVLIGAIVPALGYWAARQLDLEEEAALFSAAAVAFLPEMAIYSLRTDTVVPAALFTGSSILLLQHGLRAGRWSSLVGCGVAAGLAFWTRNDALLLLPTLGATLIVHSIVREGSAARRRQAAVIVPLAALVVAAPWLARNLRVSGAAVSPEIGDMSFFTEHNDHYAYGREFSLASMLDRQSLPEILGKRAWELAAAGKVITTTLQGPMSIAIAGGVLLLFASGDRRRWITLTPVAALLVSLLVAYPILIPFKAQAGSFKKAFVSMVPLLMPLGAYALDRAINDRRWRLGVMGLILALSAAHAVDAVRMESVFNAVYQGQVEAMAAVARTLPDTNADGEIILLAQDPFILRFVGLRSVMIPSEDRDTVLAVARRYGVDYLLMPANRPSLDPLLTGEVVDPRFAEVADVPGTNFLFYEMVTLQP
jgi:4-amino-4-deoxy-L-arabinose transferase-like glycosyltransferase